MIDYEAEYERLRLVLLKIATVTDCDSAWCSCGDEAREALGIVDAEEAQRELAAA